MDLIDTTYIIRFLLGPDEPGFDKAKAAIEKGCATLPESILETVFVLEGVYNIERDKIADALLALLEDIEIERKPAIIDALKYYGYGIPKLDYIDCLYLSTAKITGQNVLTFDKKL